MQLTDEQAEAVRLTVEERPPLCVLTGGPGTGKTATTRAVIEAAGKRGLRCKLVAPSGKAAQRLSESTGHPAATIHRALKLAPGSDRYEPLVGPHVLICDEASMVDSQVMACLLKAAQDGTVLTVLLVGDADQLPPVGPGEPFHALLQSEQCPSVRLTKIHRQAEESGIVQAAHAIVRGASPGFNETDFRFVDVDEQADIPPKVWELIQANRLCPVTSQVLAPQHKTASGVTELNRHIELARMPEGPEPLRGFFREGTKVINKRNDYKLGLFNGDLGKVVEVRVGGSRGEDLLLVQMADGNCRRFSGAMIKSLLPAWALTVHSSQGSQWDDVIVVASTSHARMLTRRLLYVAVTRAARRVWVVGQRQAVARAVNNVRDAERVTWLGRRFQRDLAKRERELEAVAS